MTNFLFDVDGTLTDARKKINNNFRRLFGDWVSFQRRRMNKVFLVTGSDKPKTVEQIGTSLYRHMDGCYQSCGNQFFIRNSLIKQSDWKMSNELREDILTLVKESMWYGKADKNIEERVGMANLSTVGRMASNTLRHEYYEWDKRNGERLSIVDKLSGKYTDLDFAIGGEISVDFYPAGKDKSQIIEDMSGKTVFFGDRCEEGGNDHTLAVRCDKYHNVLNWQETMDILRDKYCG